MHKTKIDWADYSANPVSGACQHFCWYCYANAMRKRLNWPEDLVFNIKAFHKGEDIAKVKEPAKIFVGSMHDIFGDWVHSDWINQIINYAFKYPQHIFIFLTKNSVRYLEFGFPENCWLGVTITGKETLTQYYKLVNPLRSKRKTNQNLTFVSYEPLLARPYPLPPEYFDWLIIGGLTGHKYERPDIAVEQILINDSGRPVFIKDNLGWSETRREFPEPKYDVRGFEYGKVKKKDG